MCMVCLEVYLDRCLSILSFGVFWGEPQDSPPSMMVDAVDESAQEAARPEIIVDEAKNLHLALYRKYLPLDESQWWWAAIMQNVRWQRVKYSSARFGKACETPCYTAFFGGFPEYSPYDPVPAWLKPLVDRVSVLLGVPFNALLLRLYIDGSDEIAWHTDGRTFLGSSPTIGSLSLGATAQFEMRRMNNVWPKIGNSDGGSSDTGVDHTTAQRHFSLSDGDLIAMKGDTQAHWHHRVPRVKSRRPRVNINFRYILPGTQDAERGQMTYYKYMRDGDGPEQRGASYDEILRKSGSLLGFASNGRSATGEVATPSAEAAATPPPSAASASAATAFAADGQWACPKCTLLNPVLAPVCGLCEHRRAAAAPASIATQQQPAKRQRTTGERTLASMWGGDR